MSALAHPSATLVLLAGEAGAPEVLLVRRAPSLAFHGGAWVFPGGRVDAEDREGVGDELGAARRAAVREAWEEAGVRVEPERLRPFAHWTTPLGLPKRFATWYFVACAPRAPIHVDGVETHAGAWMTAGAALDRQARGELLLPPPTFVTLTQLAAAADRRAAVASLCAGPLPRFFPRPRRVGDGWCSLYEGDAGYEAEDPDRPGARHRLWIRAGGWRYERSGG